MCKGDLLIFMEVRKMDLNLRYGGCSQSHPNHDSLNHYLATFYVNKFTKDGIIDIPSHSFTLFSLLMAHFTSLGNNIGLLENNWVSLHQHTKCRCRGGVRKKCWNNNSARIFHGTLHLRENRKRQAFLHSPPRTHSGG